VSTSARVNVFLVDVDNTLLDNDQVAADLRHPLQVEVGPERRDRYWAIFEQLRAELGYADYLGALQRYRIEFPRHSHVLVISEYLVNYPFAERLYPGSLDAIAHLEQLGTVVLLTDGDVVFQPRKIHRSNLMRPTAQLHQLGQSLWVDNITRGLLTSDTLKRSIDELSITGLTSNPTIFDHAISNGTDYDIAIREKRAAGRSDEDLFFDIALEDITAAADLFLPIHVTTDGVDGWVSLEVSPKLAYDTATTLAAARALHARAARPNLFIKIPGTREGLRAIEEAIFAGIPVNVTLLFSREQYLAAAVAYLRGLERRLDAGQSLAVASVASLFISRWDVAVAERVPVDMHDVLGIAIAKQTYKAYRELIDSPRFGRLAYASARPQRLVWASTGTKDPAASDVLYLKALQAPFTTNTMPEATLLDFADHGAIGELLPADGGDSEATLARFVQAGVDVGALAAQLQKQGANAFGRSWDDLLDRIAAKSHKLAAAAAR
jgi:transaldolase